jgi:hypothetical protein
MSKQGRNSSLKPNAIKTALRDERAHVPSDSEGGRRRFPELAHRKPEIRPPIALRVDAKLKEYAGRAIARITSCGTSDGQAVLNPRRSVVVHTSSLAPHQLCLVLIRIRRNQVTELPSLPPFRKNLPPLRAFTIGGVKNPVP